jgi:TolB-like protein/Flp pilus assembly protein TadD
MQAGSPDRVDRRLAAILAADVVGYSRLMEADEAGTARLLREHRAAADPLVAEHGGRIVKTTGDGVLVEFPSVVGAVQCAVALQKLMTKRNAGVPGERRMDWRVGIHLGDILKGDDIVGDGVNLAARLEGIAEPGGICISEDAFRQVRGKIETEFLDGGEQALKNIARPIRVYRAPLASAPVATVLPLPQKPSIAVLPFQNLSGDPEQEYFADGMVEEIITALSRIRWLFVIARKSSFSYRGQVIDMKRVGRELGVRYVLEGSVRQAGNRVRIAGQLIEAETGAHLWADRFDGPLEDVFDLQDKIASSVAGVIEPALQAAEIRRSVDRPTSDLTAYDLYLRALSRCEGGRDGIQQGLELLGRAIDRDPDYGPALALAAHCHQLLDIIGGTKDPAANRTKGIDFARKALRIARDDPDVLGRAAFAFAYFGEDLDAAIALVDRARELNPSFALGWFRSGWLRLWHGEPDLAIQHFQTSLGLSPRDPIAASFLGIGVGYILTGRFEEARAMLLRSLQESPNSAPTYRWLAVCFAQMGRPDEAREMINRLRTMMPASAPSASLFRNSEHRQLYQSGLRLALGEDG